MKIFKINLDNAQERFIYSEKLKEFESEFSYPLGETTFHIQHGIKKDYFSFFEQLGDVKYLVIEEGNKIVGAVCAILRTFDNYTKTWYLCDFKIASTHRGQKLYRKLMLKFFMRFYLKNNTMFAINMSPPFKNKIYSHSQNILKIFHIKIESRFLSQFDYDKLTRLPAAFWQEHYVASNMNKKDIIIDGKTLPLYHIVRKERYINTISNLNLSYIPSDAQFMLLTKEKLNFFENEIQISFIHKGNPGLYISSAEI